jgi:hypothetical protein
MHAKRGSWFTRMRQDFNLNDWIEYWIFELNPVVPEDEGEWGYAAVPLWDKLHSLIEDLQEKAKDPIEGVSSKKLLDQALGPGWGLIKAGHPELLALRVCQEFHIDPINTWPGLSLREKGKFVAAMQLQNAMATYERILGMLNGKK